MKTFNIVMTGLVGMLVSGAAMADGFLCTSVDGELSVKVFNHIHREDGTRNASVMILSDQTVKSEGRKTIAKFNADNRILRNGGSSYIANVDLDYSDSERGGEKIGGTTLGQLDMIILDVDFNYGTPVKSGTILKGELALLKHNGDTVRFDMSCARYLKKK